MKTKKRLLHAFGVLVTASTLSLSLAGTAEAEVLVRRGSLTPADAATVVHFPETATEFAGFLVTGLVGNIGPIAKRPVVEFTSDDYLITQDSPRSLQIGVIDGIQNFTTHLAEGVFTSFYFNAIVPQIDRNPPGRLATVTVFEADGDIFSISLNLLNNNQFLLSASPGDFFTEVKFSTSDLITSVTQLRIGGIQPSPVPEPSALWLLAAGLLGMTLVKRSRPN